MNLNCYGYVRPMSAAGSSVDCGVIFGRETATPGIDLMMPDIRFLEEVRDDILGLVLTHGHEDHIGAVAHLCRDKVSSLRHAFHRPLLHDKLEERAR